MKTKILIILIILAGLGMGSTESSANSETIRISGQVRSSDNQPIADAWIGLFDGEWNYLDVSTRTNDQGKYEVVVPILSSYIVDVYPPSNLKEDVYVFSYFGLATKTWRGDASSITVDFNLEPVGNIVLRAFDNNGNLMREKEFGWQRWVYTTDENGIRTDDRLTMLHDQLSSSQNWDNSLRLPAVPIPLNEPRVINLLWDVPSFGKVIVKADNGGEGFLFDVKGEVEIINLNYELAKTHFRIVNETFNTYIQNEYSFSENILAKINKAKEYLEDASFQDNESKRASLSDKSLNYSLYAGEELEYEKAVQDIELYRKKSVTLKITDEDGNSLPGTEINYTQTSHDFLFGNWEIAKGAAPTTVKSYELMGEAGINYVIVDSSWGNTEPTQNIYTLYRWIPNKNIKVQGHNVVWFHKGWGIGRANYLYSLSFPQLKEKVYSHVYKVLKGYSGKIEFWTLVNEAECSWTNPWHLSLEQIIEIINVSTKAARDADSSATIILNFAMPGGEAAGYRDGVLGEVKGYVPFELLEQIQDQNIDFNVIGLQLYYGNVRQSDGYGHPARDIFSISKMLDWYDKFNKTIFITEVSIPSSYSSTENFRYGYWHNLPNEETQSNWLRTFYTIAYSKPYVQSITWWDASDNGSFALYGGLLDSNNRPKLAYYTLKNLIDSWTTKGQAATDEKGNISFRGFAGNYQIAVLDYKTKTIHVKEDGINDFTLTLSREIRVEKITEEIEETAKEIIKPIEKLVIPAKNIFQKIWESIINFFRRIFGI